MPARKKTTIAKKLKASGVSPKAANALAARASRVAKKAAKK
jgi:hypothetical protein